VARLALSQRTLALPLGQCCRWRSGATEDQLAGLWRTAVAAKLPDHGISDPRFRQPARPMSAIGGSVVTRRRPWLAARQALHGLRRGRARADDADRQIPRSDPGCGPGKRQYPQRDDHSTTETAISRRHGKKFASAFHMPGLQDQEG
jgi:hypothetical protein